MRIFVIAALCAAFSGTAAAQVVDTRPALQARLISVAASNGYGTEGSQFGLDQGVPEGKSVRYAFALKQGHTYFIAGGCDDNCSNMALLMTDANSSGVAYTEDGNIIAHTPFGSGAHPSFTMTAKKTTTYSIVINVETCNGPGNTCVAGAAVFLKDGPPEVAPEKFTVSANGAIKLSDDFEDEMYCVWDSIDEETAKKAGEAGTKDVNDPEVDAMVKEAKADCSSSYGWSQREGELALMMNSTQVVMDYSVGQVETDNVSYEDIVAIRDSLTAQERAGFYDGSWLKDAAFMAKLKAALEAKGLSNDASKLAFGEMAVGASANQRTVMKAWVDFLRNK